jgi:hypothetical protein
VPARRIIYVNFDGGTFTYNSSGSNPANNVQAVGASVPGTLLPYGLGDEAQLLTELRADLAPFAPRASVATPNGILVVDQRPPAGAYHMIVVTGTDIGPNAVGQGEDNCGAAKDTTIYFAYLNQGQALTGVHRANVLGAGAGALMGLERVGDSTDLMWSFVASTNVTFTDACLLEDTTQFGFACTSSHLAYCPADQQNAVAELTAAAALP